MRRSFRKQPLVCNAQSSKGALHHVAGGFHCPTLNLCPMVRAFAEKVLVLPRSSLSSGLFARKFIFGPDLRFLLVD
jgi:hypothetical protein